MAVQETITIGFKADTSAFKREVADLFKHLEGLADKFGDNFKKTMKDAFKDAEKLAKPPVKAIVDEFEDGGKKAAKGWSESFKEGLRASMSSIKSAFTAVGTAGAAVAGVVGKGVFDNYGSYETNKVLFTNMMGGNAGEANKLMADLLELSTTSNSSFVELADGYRKLMTRGTKLSMEDYGALGDLAAYSNKSIDQLVEAMMDAQMSEFERLKEFGAKGLVNKSNGTIDFTFGEQQYNVANDKDAITKMMLDIAKSGGVAGTGALLADTVQGRFANMKDSISQMFIEIGKSGVGSGMANMFKNMTEFIKKATPAITEFANKFMNFIVPVISKTQENFMALYNSITTFLSSEMGQRLVAFFETAFQKGGELVGQLVETIGQLFTSMSNLYNNSSGFKNFVDGLVDAFTLLADGIIWALDKLGDFAEWLGSSKWGQALVTGLTAPFKLVTDAIESINALRGQTEEDRRTAEQVHADNIGASNANYEGLTPEQAENIRRIRANRAHEDYLNLKRQRASDLANLNIAELSVQSDLLAEKYPSADTSLSSGRASAAATTDNFGATVGNGGIRSVTINIERLIENQTLNQGEDPLVLKNKIETMLIGLVADVANQI